jgi:hypothetical protein
MSWNDIQKIPDDTEIMCTAPQRKILHIWANTVHDEPNLLKLLSKEDMKIILPVIMAHGKRCPIIEEYDLTELADSEA